MLEAWSDGCLAAGVLHTHFHDCPLVMQCQTCGIIAMTVEVFAKAADALKGFIHSADLGQHMCHIV
jgi:maltodextrin utilization protein YvdJ